MRKINIQRTRRDYLKYSIGVALEDLMDETRMFKISPSENQIRLILVGIDESILINFYEDGIEWFKCYTERNVTENNKLLQLVEEIIRKAV